MSDRLAGQTTPGREESDLYAHLRSLLWAVAVRRMGDPALAEDLTHAALEQTLVAVREERLAQPERAGPYALAILRNMTADHARTQQRRQRLLAREGPGRTTEDPVYVLDRERLFACFHQLEYRARLVIAATFFEERSTADIADELGVMEGNLRVMRHRALTRLRDCMERSRA